MVHCIRIPSKFLSGAQTAPKVERIAISSDAPSPLSAHHLAKEFARVSPQVTHLCLHEAMANKTTEFTDQLEDLWAFVRENQRRLGVQTDREQRHELRKKKDFVFAPMFIVHDRLRRHFGCSPPSPSPERDENERLEDNLRLYPTNLSSSYYSSSNFEANWMDRIFGAPGLWEEKYISNNAAPRTESLFKAMEYGQVSFASDYI
ncbi:hypothetical protein QCA50_007607 [Cerrena zonata]|uniref:Uncharacterized protein n=1 Tax=Cerrena zonata TaxID=2478898 RepID=A0AAW0G865_9APHY